MSRVSKQRELMTGEVKGTVCPEAGNGAEEGRYRGEELKLGIIQGI